MTKSKGKTTMPKTEEIFDGEVQLEDYSQFSIVTRGDGQLPIKTAMALSILEDGEVPPEVIKTRPGYPKPISYISHVWGTRTMNAALRWLWDFEVLEMYKDPDDGSCTTRCKMTVHIPTGIMNGVIQYHPRVICEIGAFDAYPKKDKAGSPTFDTRGNPIYTMCTADRIASAASRGLMKCMYRMFDIGTQLTDEAEPEMTAKSAWNLLLRFGKSRGLTKDQIVELITNAGIKSDKLVDRFQQAYTVIYNSAKGQEDTPNF